MTQIPPFLRPGSAKGRFLTRVLALTALGFSPLCAQEVPVPVCVQYPIFLKTLSFDRNLSASSSDTLNIGIVYQSEFRRSESIKDQLLTCAAELPIKSLNGRPLRFVPIDLTDITSLADLISHEALYALYVAPLRAVDVSEILAAAQKRKVLTLTGVPAYVEQGVALGIGKHGNRPTILINLPSSKAEGANLDSQLLNVARIIK